MKKLSLVIIIAVVLCPHYLAAFSLKVHTDKGTITINSEYRDLSQGEAIKIYITTPSLSGATARFRGEDYIFVPSRDDSHFFSLIGLGLGIKPGIYDLAIKVAYTDTGQRDFLFRLPISEKKFPMERITVEKSYIEPSPENRERMKREGALLKEVYKKYSEEWLGSGKFTLPLKGKITGGFGTQRVFNGEVRSHHRGIDLRSPRGKPVGAMNSGRVVVARNLYLSGGTVIIDHGMGLFSQYLHLSRITVKEGALIGKGEKVGRVGSTGRSTGPHLHWGARIMDQYVDPFSILSLTFD